ncbi:acylphosphatase [Sphingomonas sp. CJ99]
MTTQQVVVTGQVQRVGFRDFVVRTARQHGLIGWVRNRSDGSVEIMATGDDAALGALVDACRQGPPRARVEQVEAYPAAYGGEKGFTKRLNV